MSTGPHDVAIRKRIAAITQARLTYGTGVAAQDTATTLGFALDHARAREAVTADIDIAELAAALDAAGFSHMEVQSAAATRDDFVKRPDLGRRLPEEQKVRLDGDVPTDVALVLGDGLSAVAVALNGVAFMAALAPLLAQAGLIASPVILARQARVALGDSIARGLKAQTVVMVLGERPGLSAVDGLGIYITHNPRAHTPDSARHCLSNVREQGLRVSDAARQTAALIKTMRRLGCSGVEMNRRHAALPAPNEPPR